MDKLTAKQMLTKRAINKVTPIMGEMYRLGHKEGLNEMIEDLLELYGKAQDFFKLFPYNPNSTNFVIIREDWEGFKIKYGFKETEDETN